MTAAQSRRVHNSHDNHWGHVFSARWPVTFLKPSDIEQVECFIQEVTKYFRQLPQPVVIRRSNDPILHTMRNYAHRGMSVLMVWPPADVADNAHCACG
jgi:hypothetical protein